jgi:hypothetical protein
MSRALNTLPDGRGIDEAGVSPADVPNRRRSHGADASHPSQSDVLDELFCFDLYAASRALTRSYRPLLKSTA